MMRRTRTPRFTGIGTAAVLAVLLAGCGAGDGTDLGAGPVDEATDEPDDDAQGDARGDEDDQEPDPQAAASADAEDAADAADDATTTDGSDDAQPAEPDLRSAPDPDEADCSAHGETVTVLPADHLPDEVLATRDLLIDAALRCDEQLLFTAIEESEMFTFSFGGGDDAIGYWWDLEESGDAPFLRLAQVLATTAAIDDGGEIAVFPRVATGRPQDTTDDAWAELDWVEDLDAVRGTGEGYLGWRAGISLDGDWRFFVAGD